MKRQGFKDEFRNKTVNSQAILISSARPINSNIMSGKKHNSDEPTRIADVFIASFSNFMLAFWNCDVGEPSNEAIFLLCFLTKQKSPIYPPIQASVIAK